MVEDPIIFSIFLIFSGAALLATLALFTRQSLLVAYIVVGVLLGPSVLGWIDDPRLITQIADIGIIFLLFLLGLNLHPQNLLHMLKATTLITLISSGIFALLGMLVALAYGFVWFDVLIIGAAMMFSSTIIGLKLLPTTILHHQRMGEIVISILLLQDVIAILVLIIVKSENMGGISLLEIIHLFIVLPSLIIVCLIAERLIFRKLLQRFDKIQEYVFLLAIGWCLSIAELAGVLGLSHEVGAFIAGVVIATSPIALFISESLKPLRDFFLIMFFFSLGASFDFLILNSVWFPAILLAGLMLLLKPMVFWGALRYTKTSPSMAKEVGMRLGQVSEFSLLIAFLAFETGVISERASYLIQATTIITFVVSSYWVVLKYPTPIALSDQLRRD